MNGLIMKLSWSIISSPNVKSGGTAALDSELKKEANGGCTPTACSLYLFEAGSEALGICVKTKDSVQYVVVDPEIIKAVQENAETVKILPSVSRAIHREELYDMDMILQES